MSKYTNFSFRYVESLYGSTEGFSDIYPYEDYRDDVSAKAKLIDNRRKYAVKEGSSYIYEFVFSPFDPFLNENTPLLPNMELKLTFDRLQAEFSTISVAESNNPKSIKGSVYDLKNVYAVADYVSSTALRHHFDAIQYKPIEYVYDEVQVCCKNLPLAEQYIRVHNITGGNTPDFVFVGICKSAGLNGSLDHSSTSFQPNGVEKIDITLNGASINGYPMSISNDLPLMPYIKFQDILARTANVDLGTQLTIQDFKVHPII